MSRSQTAASHTRAVDVEEPDQLLLARRSIAQLEGALARRGTIGEALGILMERYQLDDEHAFALLSQRSQTTNRKLYELASELVEVRHTEGL